MVLILCSQEQLILWKKVLIYTKQMTGLIPRLTK